MTTSADAAREAARRRDGRFGTQAIDEATGVDLLASATPTAEPGEPDGEYVDALAYLRARLDEDGPGDAPDDYPDDVSRLFHGTVASWGQIASRGLEPREGLSDEGMLGEDRDGNPITAAVFLTPDPDEAATYGSRVLTVDASDLDLIPVEGPHGWHYACTHRIAPDRISPPVSEVRGDQVPPLTFSHPDPLDVAKIQPIGEDLHPKPYGGLWVTIGDSDDPEPTPWEQFLVDSDHRDGGRDNQRSRVCLRDDAVVARVDSIDDMRALIARFPNDPDFDAELREQLGFGSDRALDWAKVAASYDGVWVTQRALNEVWQYGIDLGGWDLESMVIFNPDAVAST